MAARSVLIEEQGLFRVEQFAVRVFLPELQDNVEYKLTARPQCKVHSLEGIKIKIHCENDAFLESGEAVFKTRRKA